MVAGVAKYVTATGFTPPFFAKTQVAGSWIWFPKGCTGVHEVIAARFSIAAQRRIKALSNSAATRTDRYAHFPQELFLLTSVRQQKVDEVARRQENPNHPPVDGINSGNGCRRSHLRASR
jgi:hypothetical protein